APDVFGALDDVSVFFTGKGLRLVIAVKEVLPQLRADHLQEVADLAEQRIVAENRVLFLPAIIKIEVKDCNHGCDDHDEQNDCFDGQKTLQQIHASVLLLNLVPSSDGDRSDPISGKCSGYGFARRKIP